MNKETNSKNYNQDKRIIVILVFFLTVTIVLWAYTSYRLMKINREIRAHQIYLIHHNNVSGDNQI